MKILNITKNKNNYLFVTKTDESNSTITINMTGCVQEI